MNIDRWPVSAVLVAAPAIAFFGMRCGAIAVRTGGSVRPSPAASVTRSGGPELDGVWRS